MVEMISKVEDRTPYIVVAFQECERMNILSREIRRSLKELDLGLKVSAAFQLPVSNGCFLRRITDVQSRFGVVATAAAAHF